MAGLHLKSPGSSLRMQICRMKAELTSAFVTAEHQQEGNKPRTKSGRVYDSTREKSTPIGGGSERAGAQQ